MGGRLNKREGGLLGEGKTKRKDERGLLGVIVYSFGSNCYVLGSFGSIQNSFEKKTSFETKLLQLEDLPVFFGESKRAASIEEK